MSIRACAWERGGGGEGGGGPACYLGTSRVPTLVARGAARARLARLRSLGRSVARARPPV